jgi:hypothetical protein
MQLFMPQRLFQPNQTTVWQSILSHKNISVKTLPWVALPTWLASLQVRAFTPCLWIVPEAVTAHALHQQLCHANPHASVKTIALLGGDFPPAQERRWKQQYREGTLTVLIVIADIADRYLKTAQRSADCTVFKTVVWVNCLPSNKIMHHWQAVPPAEGTIVSGPRFLLLNPPDARVLQFASPEECIHCALPVATTAQLQVFNYPWQATEALVTAVQNQPCTTTIVICPNTVTLRTTQAALATQACTVLSLPAGMPWVLFNTLLQTQLEELTNKDETQQPCVLLLEQSLLPAWRLFYQQAVMALQGKQPALHLIWVSLPASPIQMGLVCEGLPTALLTASAQYIKGQPRLMGLPAIWRWVLATKQVVFAIHWFAQPVIPPWQQWGIRLLLNCLLYL